ncbi:MAG: 6-phosphogluconolactonase [Chloroflexi bacterium]|nr:6-phosphogluconolactonase [Chloroflexota bacterium]
MKQPEIVILPDPVALAEAAGRRFVAAAAEAIAACGQFNVALAGGSTPAGLYRRLAQRPYVEQVDWPRVFVYFGDERCVPADHPDSNYRMARETLLDHVPLPPANVFRIVGELPPHEAADLYAHIVRADLGRYSFRPRFDLILLGMGDDGHTASLFPGTVGLTERWRLAVSTEVPAYVRPAVARVTLTLRALNAAARVMFLVAGAAKAETVRAVLTGPEPAEPLPARRVRLRNGRLVWLLDEAAAAGLRSGT